MHCMGLNKNQEHGITKFRPTLLRNNSKDALVNTPTRDNCNILIVSLYVDDLIFTVNSRIICEEFKSSMKLEFDMTIWVKSGTFLE